MYAPAMPVRPPDIIHPMIRSKSMFYLRLHIGTMGQHFLGMCLVVLSLETNSQAHFPIQGRKSELEGEP